MGRKRNRSNIPSAKSQQKMQKNSLSEKVEEVIGSVPDKQLLDDASKTELDSIEALCDELNELKIQLKEGSKHLSEEQILLLEEQESLKLLKEGLETDMASHAVQAEKVLCMQTALLEKEKALLETETSLSLREAEANAGFVEQHSDALNKLTSRLSQLQVQQQEALLQNQREIERCHESVQAERLRMLDELAREREKLSEEKATLESKLGEISARKAELEAKESNKAAWEQSKLKQFEQQYIDKVTSLELSLASMTTYRQRDGKQLAELQKRLSDYAELERILQQKNMNSAEELMIRIDELESEVRGFRQELAGRPQEDLEGEVEYLKESNQQLEDQLRDLTQELQEKNMEVHQRAMGVMERQQIAMKNRVLQQHNDALSLATEQLKNEIGGLKDMQQGQDVFPALTRMDRELGEAATTQPVPSLDEFVSDLQVRIAQTEADNPLYFSKDTLRLFLGGLAMSQLHIFQGISGTGKTSLAKAFAAAMGGHCTVVPVQAGWRDRDDLVGHYNAFEKRYYEKECLQAMYKAHCPAYKDRFNIVLLDEMNLSRPEQYFAEFLSALELTGKDRQVVLMENAPHKFPQHLREGRKIGVPDNLWFIGTANHDETTFEFADKTHDRSFVLELNRCDEPVDIRTLSRPATYSSSSLRKAFEGAIKQHRPEVDKLFKQLKQHEITQVLEKRFGIGWGNRLERQARQFIPVVMAAGGSSSQALDHLLSVRLFRDGKVTGRYDTKQEHLSKLQSCLNSVWESISNDEMAYHCDDRLTQEIERKETA